MVLLCLQNYNTQRMDYFAYNRTLRQLDCCEEVEAMQTVNRFSCDDPDSADDITVRLHALFGKIAFKLPIDQTAPDSERTRLVMGVCGMYDKGIIQAVCELLERQGVSVRSERLANLQKRIKRLQLASGLVAAGVVSVVVATVIAAAAT